MSPNIWGFYFVFGQGKAWGGYRVWFNAHQIMDDISQGPDDRNAEEGDAE